ncbi:hypothetical protein J4210_05645 [Candidatus Woesearchaeota archaeon]|nr:hypothetical protein [Candidatus Woesearchaeota archaeon]
MLTDKQVAFLREELALAKNPLFFYDGDADGLTAFLLLYRLHREGKGFALSTTSTLGEQFLRKVEEFNPDKIFVLDIPLVTQEFIDGAKRPIFWIDHHPVQDRTGVHYYNPRIKEPSAYIPTSRMAWQVSERPEDLWIAVAGSLADWHAPDELLDQFVQRYPLLLPEKSDLATMIYTQPVGKLVKFFFFIQKGPSSEVRKSIKVLTRINAPEEIFEQQNAAGKFLFKRFAAINQKYEAVLTKAKKVVTSSKIILYKYTENEWSFTVNLANELMAFYPDKYVVIARQKSGEMKCSLRGKNILSLLQRALVGVSGSGGGHDDACGAVIKEEDWDIFFRNLNEAVTASSI